VRNILLLWQQKSRIFSGEKRSAIVIAEEQNISLVKNFCNCGNRRAEYLSGKKHSAVVVAEEQNFLLCIRKLLQLW